MVPARYNSLVVDGKSDDVGQLNPDPKFPSRTSSKSWDIAFNHHITQYFDTATLEDMTAAHLESITSAAGGEQIELSFDNSAGGAWDDRELINSYDAAMDEFHVSYRLFEWYRKLTVDAPPGTWELAG